MYDFTCLNFLIFNKYNRCYEGVCISHLFYAWISHLLEISSEDPYKLQNMSQANNKKPCQQARFLHYYIQG